MDHPPEDDGLKGAVEDWLNSKTNERIAKQNLKDELRKRLTIYNPTELEQLTGIKRQTIYYILWGKSGRRQDYDGIDSKEHA